MLWYEHYQCTADTMQLLHDSSGLRRAYLHTDCFAMQQVDREKFNQLKGRQGVVYFDKGEPLYADVAGNAQMVFFIEDEDEQGRSSLVGANAGRGSSIRIYFDSTHAASRVVTYDKPDMQTYPVDALPDEMRRMQGFLWLNARRPQRWQDVFKW